EYARRARMHLSKADPVLARIIAEVGPLGIQPRRERFQALARAIIFQQLAGAAANAIYGRFVALFPGVDFPSPEQVLAKTGAELRAVGLSEKKALYLKDLAAHIRDGKLDFHRFHKMTDEEIIEHLVMVKGIGRWTAEMFLMFNLGRPDVMPAGDLGVQNAIKRHYRMRQRPNRKRLLKHAERWRPYRTAAAWYLWRSLDIVLPDGATKPATKKVAKRKK
ncbi:DNA-3-methyladenine glycosylase family protein, partial [Candidatus Binatus sp.]|uniref:DNA-3-methyladenine glycosylase family protein n=1 Tax=Candidatus Binatus sp. TaxID=2811406 RepID=UPI003CC670C9